MDEALQRTLLRRLFDLRERRTTSSAAEVYRQPAANYTDPRRCARELRACFTGRPLIAGLSCELPRGGTYFTVRLGDVAVLVVRGEDGAVRAFLNACRHRGARVAEGCGHAGRVFKCPYHAWAYDIDGRLLGQPLAKDAFAGVDADETGLIALPAVEEGGLILVAARPDAVLGQTDPLAGLSSELGSLGLEGLHRFAEHEDTWSFNYKQPYETFLEAYHIFSLHQETLAREVLSTPMLADGFGPHGRGVLMGRRAAEMAQRDEAEWRFAGHANLVYWLFPNTVLNLPMTGHAELWQFYPVDGRPDRTRVHARFYTPGEPRTDKDRGFWERMQQFTTNVVNSEDLAQQEEIYANLRTGLLPELVFGRNEPALIHYHRAMQDAVDAVAV